MRNFYELTPDTVLAALESEGFQTTGRVLQLNSYENRVFEIELEGGERIVSKFYRPGRWSRDQILEEHQFLDEIAADGIKTAQALKLPHGSTVSETHDILWSVFPKIRGRLPQELLDQDLKRVGRALAHIHNVGSQKKARHRLTLDVETYGRQSLKAIEKHLTPEVRTRYLNMAEELFEFLEPLLNQAQFLRIHGDCHRGNLLDSGSEFFFVDFDDFCNGPAAQDFWMLMAGDFEEQQDKLDSLLTGYEELRHLDDFEFELFEPLRGLRMIHYSGWIARRWDDPSFPSLFPEFGSYSYWAEEIEALGAIVS